MAKYVRELIQKGDPVARLQLPETLIQILRNRAKKRKRRIQDQFIKSLAETLKNESAFSSVSEKLLPELKTIYPLK